MLTKQFAIKTAWLNLPKGEDMNSPELLKKLARVFKNMIPGAEHVEVDFARNAQDQPLLETLWVTAECSPVFGKMISTAGIDDAAAKALAEVIKALASGQDASQAIQHLQQAASGGGAPEKDPAEKKSPFDKEDDESAVPGGGAGAGPKPPGAPGPGLDEAPTGPPTKKKMPFAGKRTGILKRASDVAKEYEMSLGDATQVVRTIDEAESFGDALEDLQEMLVDEEGHAHEPGAYARLAWIARGRQESDLKELGIPKEAVAPLVRG